jgi:hypothetical protein
LKKFIFISLSLLLLILIPGCFTFPAQAPNPTPPVSQPSVIREFSSNPSAINSGGTSTLLWNVTGANSVSIDQGIGLVDVAGTRVVSPATSTVYTISATNSAGTVTRSATTILNPAPLPPSPIPFAVTSVTAVTGIVVGIDQYPFTGPCPKTVNFWGTIAANGPCTVTYVWERSDGTATAPGTITFIADGSQTVTNLWTRGEGSGWQRLHVLTPNDAISSQIDFAMTCWDLSQ